MKHIDADAVLKKCSELRRFGRFADAASILDDAIQHQADARLLYSRGITLDLMDHRANAVEDLTSAIMLDPTVAKGSILAMLEKDEEAIRDFQQVLKKEPSNYETHRQCCLSLLAMGRPNRALEHAEAALRLAPDEALTHFCLGESYMSLQRFADAESAFRRAVELEPSKEHYAASLASAIEKLQGES